MRSVSEKLEERADSTDDNGFHRIFDELSSNWEIYNQELEEPTLKHGTDTANIEDVVEEGLVPGAENNAETGELSNCEDVCFSTSYPIALRYAELTEANNHLRTTDFEGIDIGTLESPMVVEIPIRSFDTVKVNPKNEETIIDLLGADLANKSQTAVVLEACDQETEEKYPLDEFIDYDENGLIRDVENGDKEAQEAAYSLLNNEGVDTETLTKYGAFEHLDHNELDASFLNELRADHGPKKGMRIYVPQDEVNEYRENLKDSDIKIGSLEARALLHEARMEDQYEEGGCIEYRRPEDSETWVNIFEKEEDPVPHDSSPEVVHISRLEGTPIYPKA